MVRPDAVSKCTTGSGPNRGSATGKLNAGWAGVCHPTSENSPRPNATNAGCPTPLRAASSARAAAKATAFEVEGSPPKNTPTGTPSATSRHAVPTHPSGHPGAPTGNPAAFSAARNPAGVMGNGCPAASRAPPGVVAAERTGEMTVVTGTSPTKPLFSLSGVVTMHRCSNWDPGMVRWLVCVLVFARRYAYRLLSAWVSF